MPQSTNPNPGLVPTPASIMRSQREDLATLVVRYKEANNALEECLRAAIEMLTGAVPQRENDDNDNNERSPENKCILDSITDLRQEESRIVEIIQKFREIV